MADTTTKTLRLTIAASTSTAEQAFANLNKEIKNTGVSITGFTTAMTKNASGMDSYAHYVTLASTSLKELEQTQKSIVGSSTKAPITSNILKDERDIYKERADLATKSSAEMTAKAKAAVTAQVIAAREGEDSITAIKNAAAERQKQIESNLQEKLKAIRDRYAAGELNKGNLNLAIKAITDAYQRQTIALTTETDKRIAKIKEETEAILKETKRRVALVTAADEEAVARFKSSLAQKLAVAREGEDSITAVKLAAAEKQRRAESKLQADLKAIQDRFISGEIGFLQQAGARNKALADYETFILRLNEATDRRIAKIRAEAIAEQEALRVSRLSIAQRLGEAQVYTPRSDAGIALTRGMTQAGLAARPTVPQVQAPVIPPIPQETRSSYDSLFARIGAINIEYRLWNATINTVLDSLRAIPKIGIELDATRAVLTATMGSEAGVSSALKALDEEAKRTGITIGALRESFRTFHASTSLAGESLQDTWTMFTNLNTVSTALHLTTDQTNHVFLAMAQIFNKSKVQSEELVKQLGNLLPGAFAMFAKSMGISTMELSKQMKDGLVFAHETMKDFTQFMSDRFAASFAVASDGLNANLGRMQSGFTHLGEAIYASSKGPMNSVVKTITAVTEALKDDIQGQNKFIAAVQDTANALGGVLVGALLATIPNLATLKTSFEALILSIRGTGAAAATTRTSLLSLGDTAVIAVLTTVALKFTEIGREQAAVYADASARFKALQQEKLKADLGKPIEVRVEASENVSTAKKQLADIKTEWDAILKAKSENAKFRETDLGLQPIAAAEARIASAYVKQQDLLQKTREAETLAINKWDKENRQKILNLGELSTTEIGSMHVAALRAAGKTVEAAGEDFDNTHKKALDKAKQDVETLTKAIEDERKAATPNTDFLKDYQTKLEEANKYVADATIARAGAVKEAQERADKQSQASAKKGAAERLRGIKEEISVVQEYQRTAANDAKTQIDILNADNKAKVLSFEEYAKRKQEILDKDYKAEKDFYEKQKALAEQSGKKSLVADANEKLKRLEQDYQAKSATSQADTSKNIEDYNTNLANIHSKYLDILGVENDSNEQTKVKNAELRKQIVAETTIAGIVGETAKARLKEFDAVENNLKVQAKFKDYQENMKVAQDKFGESVARINVLKNVGAINDFTAAQKMKAANLEAISDREKEISLMEDKLKLEQESGSPIAKSTQEAIRKARAELENFKLEADTVGQYFENTLGSAFENSFQGLITGSMNASQAFKSFATSVVSDIAKIIAQEARSAILRPILAAGFNALGGLFSSGPSVAAGNSESFSSAMQGSNWMTAKVANGGVFSGAGISAHSGTIVNSPTVFPFAKGVGLMGEAGPEAILPLKRNSQGKLGVSVDNTGQERGSNIYYINTTVNAGSNATPDSIANKASEAVIRAIAKQEINSAARPGNRLNQITKYGY